MKQLEFRATEVNVLITHALAADNYRAMNTTNQAAGPRLWLVGDRGVYLMSNGSPVLKNDEGFNVVAFAIGMDPVKDEDWNYNKRAIFGGDDGADELDFIPAISDQIRQSANTIRFGLTETSISLLPLQRGS